MNQMMNVIYAVHVCCLYIPLAHSAKVVLFGPSEFERDLI